MKKFFLALFAPFILTSCGTDIYEIAITGKPYELLVVTPREVWASSVGDTLKSIFGTEVEWVNQVEPIFDLQNMAPEGFNDLSRRHRNLLMVNIKPQTDSVTFRVTPDKWANNQILITLDAPSDSSAANYLSENRDVIVSWLSNVERDRMASRGKKHSDAKINQLIKDKFGVVMSIPTGYRIRKDTTNFLWVSYEMPLASQGFFIYTFKRKDGKLDILGERNIAAAQIPGPSAGSFMSTDTIFRPEVQGVVLNGREWVEVRGFWNVKGDFMGGPFMDYVTFDKANDRYVAIDMYVLSPSPKYPKRNYIRQLESLMMNVSMPN